MPVSGRTSEKWYNSPQKNLGSLRVPISLIYPPFLLLSGKSGLDLDDCKRQVGGILL